MINSDPEPQYVYLDSNFLAQLAKLVSKQPDTPFLG